MGDVLSKDVAVYRVVTFESPPDWCDERRTRGLGAPWDERVVELLDSAPHSARCWRCGTAVGYVASDESNDLLTWVFVALVSGPGTDVVSVQCEECCPDALSTPWTDREQAVMQG